MPSNTFTPVSSGGSAGIKQLANDGFTSIGVILPAPTETPDAVNQIGEGPSHYLWQSTSTAPGAWTPLEAKFLGGITAVGDPSLSSTQNAFGDIYWFFAGKATSQNLAQATINNGLNLVNCNPYGSGSALNIGYVGKTAVGTLLCVNSSAENIYLHSQYAGSFLITPENGPTLDGPGVVTVLSGDGGRPIALATTFAPTGTVANYPWLYADPIASPYKTHFPKFVDTKINPHNVGWIDALVINHTTGDCSMPGSLLMGTGGVRFTLANGKLDYGAFDATEGGVFDVSTAQFNVHQIFCQPPFGTIAANTMGINLHTSGIGFNWDSVGGLLGCGWQGNVIWTTAGPGTPFNFALDIATNVVGKGLRVKEGVNGKMGIATLAAGSAVVANTSVTATSRIFLTSESPGGTIGFLSVSARTAGTSFTISSSNALDTSNVSWLMMEPG